MGAASACNSSQIRCGFRATKIAAKSRQLRPFLAGFLDRYSYGRNGSTIGQAFRQSRRSRRLPAPALDTEMQEYAV